MEQHLDLPSIQTSTLWRWLRHVQGLAQHEPKLQAVAEEIVAELSRRERDESV